MPIFLSSQLKSEKIFAGKKALMIGLINNIVTANVTRFVLKGEMGKVIVIRNSYSRYNDLCSII